MRVVAFDPGPSYGIAIWDGQHHESYQFTGDLVAAIHRLESFLDHRTQLVIEKFVISNSTIKKNKEAAYTTLYMVGCAQKSAADKQCVSVRLQKPDERSWAEPFLACLGWYRTGTQVGQPDADDANAASAHLLAFLESTRTIPQDLLTKIIDLEIA